MPSLNLGCSNGLLDPIAHWRLIALMAHPRDRSKRHRFNRLGDELYLEQNDARAERAMDRVQSSFIDGVVAGDCLLYLLQLHEHHAPASLNKALLLPKAAILHDADLPLNGLPRDLTNPARHDALEALQPRKIHRATLLNLFKRFQPVSHLWAAYILSEYLNRNDLNFLASPQNLAKFVAVSAALADRAAKVPLKGTTRDVVLPPRIAWRIRIPGVDAVNLQIKIPRLRDVALNIVTDDSV